MLVEEFVAATWGMNDRVLESQWQEISFGLLYEFCAAANCSAVLCMRMALGLVFWLHRYPREYSQIVVIFLLPGTREDHHHFERSSARDMMKHLAYLL